MLFYVSLVVFRFGGMLAGSDQIRVGVIKIMTREIQPNVNELWDSAMNSLNAFLKSSEARDIDWKRAKAAHFDYIEARMEEIRRWLDCEIPPDKIGPLADARNIFWDEPETSLQKEYCESVFKLFNLLRQQKIGTEKTPTRPAER